MPPVCVSVLFGFGPPLGVFGVGQDEEPFALVWGADFRRREEPFRDPVAKAFEVWANNVPISEPKVSSHVLEEAPIRLALSDDSAD